MTNREFYENIIKANVSDEITAKAEALLQRAAESNSARAKKKAEANAPLIEAIRNFLAEREEAVLGSEIAKALDITTSKAVACAKKVDGIKIVELKVGGRKVNGYLLAE